MRTVEPDVGVGAHAESVIVLENALARVRDNKKTSFAAVITCEGSTTMIHDYIGAYESHFAAAVGCDTLKARILEAVTTRQIPEHDASVPANLVCYDLRVEPAQFDFPSWLAYAEMQRVRENSPGPLRVAFIDARGEDEPEDHFLWRQSQLRNVLAPMVKMMGGELTEDIRGRRYNVYSLRFIVEAYNRGDAVPKFKPAFDLGLVHPPVTITLREVENRPNAWPHRNSNIDAWVRFARRLRAAGESVIFVRDTQKADEPLEDFEIAFLASKDLYTRQALYESAKCNLFVSNGPWNMALFGAKPWLMFNKISASDPYHANMPKWWEKHHGIKEGEQFPWCGPDQRIVWAADDYETLCGAWEGQLKAWERLRAA